MTPFSPETQRMLLEHGWQEDRQVDVAAYEAALRAAGHDDCQAPCEFLRRYGDLEIGHRGDVFDTDMSRIMRMMERWPVSGWSEAAGRTLYVIGICRFDFMILLMDASGRVYRHMEMTSHNDRGIDLYRIAATGEEAIEAMVREYESGEDIKGEFIAHAN